MPETAVEGGAAAEPQPPARRAADPGSSSSSDEEEDEASQRLWGKVVGVLEEFHLSPFAMAAAKKWVRLMGDPSNTYLDRVREWLLLRVNNRARAPPADPWQRGCPDICPRLRAQPFWARDDPGMAWMAKFEEHYDVIRDELLALRGQARPPPALPTPPHPSGKTDARALPRKTSTARSHTSSDGSCQRHPPHRRQPHPPPPRTARTTSVLATASLTSPGPFSY